MNWKVRLKNKWFWVTLIPMVLLLVTLVLDVFGVTLDLTALGDKLARIVEVVFIILGIMGITNDPTTEGLTDSKLAMTYENPKPKGE